MSFASLLNNMFTVSRRYRASDGQGGWTITWVDVGTISGRLRPTNSNERMVADAEQQQITHVLYTEYGVDIERGDLVRCGDVVVEVLGIREPSLAGHHWEIDCLERQEEVSEELGS